MKSRPERLLIYVLILALVFLFVWLGCSKTSTEVGEDEEETPDDDEDDDDQADDDDTGADNEAPQPPTVDDPRSPTSLDYQTVTGIAEPGAYVKVTGGGDEPAIYADANTGQFCVQVSLILNMQNILSITATDQAGNQSDPTNVSIDQVRNNVCLTSTATASSVSHSESDRVPGQAIDGNYSSYWANTSQPWYAEALRKPQWYRVALADLESINRIDIYWEDDSYATEYELYYSDSETEPIEPHKDDDWRDDYTLIAAQSNPDVGYGGHDQFDLSAEPVQARWLLMALFEGSNINVLLYKYKMQEFEAYSLQSGESDPGCE